MKLRATLEQLSKGPVWDGNLISKSERDELKIMGFVDRIGGWNFLTKDGVSLCLVEKILRT